MMSIVDGHAMFPHHQCEKESVGVISVGEFIKLVEYKAGTKLFLII